MRTWFPSDTHLGHTNIIDYCERPFVKTAEACQLCHGTGMRNFARQGMKPCRHPDVEANDKVIIESWNERVAPNDIVYHLGDFAFGNFEKIASYAKRLNGKKVLIKGNHDRLSDGCFTRMGFLVRRHMLVGSIHLSHHPPWPVSSGRIYLCGHVHNLWKKKEYGLQMSKPARLINVGVDVRQFRPVTMTELGLDENLLV